MAQRIDAVLLELVQEISHEQRQGRSPLIPRRAIREERNREKQGSAKPGIHPVQPQQRLGGNQQGKRNAQ